MEHNMGQNNDIWIAFLQRVQLAQPDYESWCSQFLEFVNYRGNFSYKRDKKYSGIAPRFTLPGSTNILLIKHACELFQIGTYHTINLKNFEQRAQWEVTSKAGLNLLITFFEHYPLDTKERQEEYSVWKLMAETYIKKGCKAPELPDLAKKLSKFRKRGQSRYAQRKLGVKQFLYPQPLTSLANPDNLDSELKNRCLSCLVSDIKDPKNWDNAVRVAGVILEERLHDVGQITDRNRIGRDLVNDIFNQNGTLITKFENDSERVGYRDLFAGIVGVFRNPSAHRLLDPDPEEGGAYLAFINLLLRKLENLR
jgi:hypothetical protein